jgi:eukaryotic-like serine/threonine-protein kinase
VGPGDVLASRYELRDTIGRGGMGEVYRAFDQSLQRDVAVKVLPVHLIGDATAERRFTREAQRAASLTHPNIVTVHDAVSEPGLHAIVMELIDGPSLADVLRDEGPLPTERAFEVAGGVAAALAAAHERGLIHRDVKPSNILIAPDGTPKLADFGIARATDATKTSTATVHGSAPYMAPEQATGGEVDGRTDVYALGCVLYEMLTGRAPFMGDDALGIVYQHLHDDPQPPSAVNPELPAEFDGVVLKALQKDPDARFATADDLRTALLSPASIPATQVMAPVATTQVIDPAATRVAAPVPPPSRTTVVDARSEPSSSAGRWVVFALLAAVLIAALLAFAGPLSDMFSSAVPEIADTEPAAPAESEPEAETEPEQTEEPEPTEEPPAEEPTETETQPEWSSGPEDAADGARATIDEGESAEEIEAKAADELRKRVDDVIKEVDEGRKKAEDGDENPEEEALDKIDELRGKIGERAEKGEVSEDYANRLYTDADELEAAVRDEFS